MVQSNMKTRLSFEEQQNKAITSRQGTNDQGPKPQGQTFISENTTTVIYRVTLTHESFYDQNDDHAWWIDSG